MHRPSTHVTPRRRWRKAGAAIAVTAVALTGCGGSDDADAPEPADTAADDTAADDTAADEPDAGEPDADAGSADQLTILEWAGYELPEFYPGFVEAHPDVDLDYQFGDSDADFLTKVQAGGVDPDIIHPCAGWIGLWQEAGEIHPLDTDLLTNWDSLDEDMREAGLIDGEYYFAPFDWGYTSIIVATDRVDEVPTSWRSLWDEQYANRLSVWNDAEEAVMFTSYAWGLDPYDLSDDDVEVLREKLAELHSQVLTYWEDVSSLDQMMIDGEVDIAQAWNETLAAMTDAGVPGEYIDPEEGRLGWVCGYSVAAEPGTAEYALAHEYIDAAISAEAGQYLVDAYYYGHANLDTIELADPDVVDLIELDRLDVRDRTNFYQPLTQEQRELWSRLWTEATAG